MSTPNTTKQEMAAIAGELKTQLTILGSIVAIFWVLEIADQFIFNNGLNAYGILPRNIIGLRGILFSPFLHGNFPHLIANTFPFLILGWLVMLRETKEFFVVTAIATFVSGAGTWLFGSPAFHIGASGVIFGYLGFLLLRGYFERSFAAIFLSVVVAFFYGSLVWGVLPGQPGISWEGHLFGFIGGILAARLLGRKKQK